MSLMHLDVPQGTQDWLDARLGMFTASRAAAAMLRNKPKTKRPDDLGEFSAKRRHLATALATERVMRRPAYDKAFQTEAMSRGTELEPQAVAIHALRSGVTLETTGFWRHPTLAVGVSYDGLTPDRTRGVEVKCLWPDNHLEFAQAVMEAEVEGRPLWDAIPPEYQWQVTHQMAWFEGLEWMDFVCYCPEFPEPLDLVVVPVVRTWEDGAEYRGATEVFLAEVDRQVEKVEQLQAWLSGGRV